MQFPLICSHIRLLGIAACLSLQLGYANPALAQVPAKASELQRWQAQAQRVNIVRDQWGIPHISGKTDADAVFGMLYAQAEDDFQRIEMNYINALGRLAEVEGEAEIWRDLRMKLFIQPEDLKARYARSPVWLKQLMGAFADGLNFYLHRHPEVTPKLITRFEPWMALAFSEGSIGGDIESINLKSLAAFYSAPDSAVNARALAQLDDAPLLPEPRGSNGFAIAPKLSANGHAMLLINPHTSFYFRPEIQVTSEQGLNAYGAVTWGQFFVYQGFNTYNGWMHTSDAADVIDEFLLKVRKQDGAYFYEFEGQWRPLKTREIKLPYRTAKGMAERSVTTYASHHGPVIRSHDGKWVAIRLMHEPTMALMQSYLRTKTRNYAEFVKVMDLRANSSNNTVYADRDGTIAYFHGNFVPRRNARFDYSLPVDGSIAATDWQGLHAVKDIIQVRNPANGWLQNTNNWPFSVAGTAPGNASPKQSNFPNYMWSKPENARGLHAVKLLEKAHDLSLDGLIELAYDSELTAFASLLPPLFAAYDAQPDAALAEQIATLRAWDLRSSLDSVATSLAIYWAQDMVQRHSAAAKELRIPVVDFLPRVAAEEQIASLRRASERLQNDFGEWKTAWGEINRFQRLTGAINAHYDDQRASFPVPFASGNWGSLAAFGMSAKQSTKRIYGDRGNSFVAVVSFGPRVQAKSILAGGESGDPSSPHFQDQAQMYSKAQFKQVLFYPEEISAHAKRRYHPGQ